MNDERILFAEMIQDNLTSIRSLMRWENYTLNQTLIEVTEQIKDDAIMVLNKNYGRNLVYKDIVDDFLTDVFVYFPVLLQQLAITRLIDADGVVKDDINTMETIRTEELNTTVDQLSTLTQGTSLNDTNTLNTQNKSTGTVSTNDDASNTQTSKTSIENKSGIEATGTRNVSLGHNMPEQSLSSTGNFTTDEQGTPILSSAYVQEAQEGFSTSNPINSSEKSEQNINNSDVTKNNSVTTNDLSNANTGTTSRVVINSGADTTDALSETKGKNDFKEKVTSITTNKQYAYEVKAFLETAESTIAFKNWIDNFSWIDGII